MKNETQNLRLVVTELSDIVELSIECSGKSILKFTNEAPPKVRVKGYQQCRITKEHMYETAMRESNNNINGALGVVNHYIYSREKEIYDSTLELRRIMRRLIISTESAEIARLVISEILRLDKN